MNNPSLHRAASQLQDCTRGRAERMPPTAISRFWPIYVIAGLHPLSGYQLIALDAATIAALIWLVVQRRREMLLEASALTYHVREVLDRSANQDKDLDHRLEGYIEMATTCATNTVIVTVWPLLIPVICGLAAALPATSHGEDAIYLSKVLLLALTGLMAFAAWMDLYCIRRDLRTAWRGFVTDLRSITNVPLIPRVPNSPSH